MTIGFIGLGIMGSRMAANLQHHGHTLVVHNRTREKAEALLAGGAAWAATPAALAPQVDVVWTMLGAPEHVWQAALGADGFLERLPAGTRWVDSTTVNPSFAREMAGEAAARGIRYLDAPVSGSLRPAQEGQLLFLVGGDAADVEALGPLFRVMGRDAVHVGEAGLGAGMKMLFNMLLGIQMAAFAEALTLGEAMGLSRARLLDTLLPAQVVAPFVAGKRQKLMEEQFEPEFPLRWMLKDLHLAALTAYEHDVPMPVEHAAKELYALAARAGLDEQDFSAVFRLLAHP